MLDSILYTLKPYLVSNLDFFTNVVPSQHVPDTQFLSIHDVHNMYVSEQKVQL